jgi:signal transduction histidine kinase
MSFRARLFLAFTLAVLLPLLLLAWGVRREVDRRLAGEYARRAERVTTQLAGEISDAGRSVSARLRGLADQLAADNRFRLAVRGDPAARRELLDWGVAAARLSGLPVLELHDSAGTVLSSGHFRNQYDRGRPALSRALAGAGDQPVLLRARTPEGTLLVLARAEPLVVGGERFTLVGGVRFGEDLERRSPDPEIGLLLAAPDSAPTVPPGQRVVERLELRYLDAESDDSTGRASVAVVQSDATLAALRRPLDRWFLAALAAAAALGLALAAWLATRVSRPLADLARRTEAIDLDRLDQDFATARTDEIGVLARGLGGLTERLRAGAARLREAERRVAMGDLARQVNHDIKNGLAPIRHVLRHLDEVAPAPESLATVYRERRGTLESSVAYLETLARSYARLTPATGREPCDPNAVVREVVRAVPPERAVIRAVTSPAVGTIPTDRIALRRILENLVGNAVDSVAGTGGAVEVTTEAARRDGEAPVVRITVADAGPGMSRGELDRAFDDFYTTKDGGTGLGLSIVRRLVLDLGGALRVDTRPGEGTRVTVELPAAAGEETP